MQQGRAVVTKGRDTGALWSIVDHVYVVNLPERTDRRRQVAGELARLGLSFDHPRVTLFEASRPDEPGNFPNIGSRGCFESHMGVLRRMLDARQSSALLLEDDVKFSSGIEARVAELAAALEGRAWHMLYGHAPGAETEAAGVPAPLSLERLAPETGLRLTHMVGLSAEAARRLLPFLEGLHGREMYHPRGGAMHVDGAYSTYRAQNPDFRVLATRRRIAWQRPSRSDIHAPKWFERAVVLRPLLAGYRTVKQRLR